MSDFMNRTFLDSYVDLTGKKVMGCTFDGCVIHLDKDGRTDIEGVVMNGCMMTGDGWPKPFIEVVLKAGGGPRIY